MSKFALLIFASSMVFATSTATAEEPDSVELGAVAWKRDFPAAKKMAQESGKPLLMFFQEVPG